MGRPPRPARNPHVLGTTMVTATLPRTGAGLDTTVRLVTPERIAFQYPLAGPFRRLAAYLVDLIVIAASAVTALIGTSLLGEVSGTGPFLVILFALTWGYGIFCEGLFNGRTLGKKAAGLRVVSDVGTPITGAQAVVRNIVGAFDGPLPFFYLPGLTAMVLSPRFRRLGDLAAGTMVIVEEPNRRAGVARVESDEVARLLPFVPVRLAAGPDLARALSDYARARGRFGTGRREEMAAPLAFALARRHGLPAGFSADAVLCACYHRVFLGE